MIRMDWWAAPRGYPENLGRTICLLGTAGRGPIKEPVLIEHPDQATAIFGTEGTLTRAAIDIYSLNPLASIYCFRISGAYATLDMDLAVGEATEEVSLDIVRGLHLRSRLGNESDDEIGINFAIFQSEDPENIPGRGALLMFGAEGQTLRTYWLHDYPTVGELVRIINEDADRGDSPCYASTDWPAENSGMLTYYMGPDTLYLSGGQASITLDKDELFLALSDAYELLLGRHIDVIIPLGAYLDDAYLYDYWGSGEYSEGHFASPEDHLTLWDTDTDAPATYHAQLVEFCRAQQGFGWMSHGVIGMRPLTDPLIEEDPSTYILQIVEETALKKRLGLVDGEGDSARDYGGYLSIVAADLLYQPLTPNEHWDTGALAYAAMICGMDSALTTTNRVVPGNLQQRIEFDTETLRDLAYLGVVAFRTSVKHSALVVSNGVTAALPSRDAHLLSNVRMMQIAICNLNALIRDFKGENIDDLRRSGEVERQVTDLMDNLKLAGILRDYRFFHRFNTATRGLIMNLQLQTRNSLEHISASGELTLMGEGV
jgi:hypothetical protein